MANQIDSPTGIPQKDDKQGSPSEQTSAEKGGRISETVRKVSESTSSHPADEPTGPFTTSHANP